MKKILSILTVAVLAFLAISAMAQESKYAFHATAADLVFAPYQSGGKRILTGIFAKSDKLTATVSLMARGGAGKKAITTASTSGAQIVYFSNASNAITTNDWVVYVYGDGAAPLLTSVSANSTGTATMATGISQAGTTSDWVYEVTTQGVFSIGTTALNLAADTIFATPGDSPLAVRTDGGSNAYETATAR